MADEQKDAEAREREDKRGGSGYTVNADGSVTYDEAEPSEETRKAAQAEVEEAAAKRDAEAEEAAKKAGEEAIAASQAAPEQEQASEDTTTTRETAEGGMAREKGTV